MVYTFHFVFSNLNGVFCSCLPSPSCADKDDFVELSFDPFNNMAFKTHTYHTHLFYIYHNRLAHYEG